MHEIHHPQLKNDIVPNRLCMSFSIEISLSSKFFCQIFWSVWVMQSFHDLAYTSSISSYTVPIWEEQEHSQQTSIQQFWTSSDPSALNEREIHEGLGATCGCLPQNQRRTACGCVCSIRSDIRRHEQHHHTINRSRSRPYASSDASGRERRVQRRDLRHHLQEIGRG